MRKFIVNLLAFFIKSTNTICHMIKSTYLCIKYPFLYPRNRFNDKHYNNWAIHEYLYGKKDSKYNSETKKWDSVIIKEGIRDKAFKYVPNPTEDNRFNEDKVIINIFYYIWFNVVLFTHDYILQIIHCIPTYTEWDAMPDGWRKAFGDEYLKRLKKQLKKDNYLYSWRITQIKEKWGELRLYCNFGSDELYRLIDYYENLSSKICINCGKPATKLSSGWIMPHCNECFEKLCKNEPYAELVDGEWKYNDNFKY